MFTFFLIFVFRKLLDSVGALLQTLQITASQINPTSESTNEKHVESTVKPDWTNSETSPSKLVPPPRKYQFQNQDSYDSPMSGENGQADTSEHSCSSDFMTSVSLKNPLKSQDSSDAAMDALEGENQINGRTHQDILGAKYKVEYRSLHSQDSVDTQIESVSWKNRLKNQESFEVVMEGEDGQKATNGKAGEAASAKASTNHSAGGQAMQPISRETRCESSGGDEPPEERPAFSLKRR